MSLVVERTSARGRITFLTSPLTLLVAALIVVVLLLALPISVPIGPMYWDSYIYYDGAARIFDGQIPSVDYFAPVGPLGYYLFAGWLALFPNAQTTLITHWALLALSVPLMAVVVADVDQRSRRTAWALLVPFLIFSLLPFNSREFYPFPSSDGFGIYNRQICQMLYVLAAALLFVRHQGALSLLVAVVMTSLFFLKITGFISGGLICVFALLAGRISFRHSLYAAVFFLAVLALCELSVGMVSSYIADIEALVATNSDTLLPRLIQSVSINIDIVATSLALGVLVTVAEWRSIKASAADLLARPMLDRLARFADHDPFWLAALIVAGIFFEAQNTGSQAFIFLWPVLWRILARPRSHLSQRRLALAIGALAAAVYLPMVVGVLERSARTYIGALNTVEVPDHNLKGLGNVSTRDYVMKRAETMLRLYPQQQAELQQIAAEHELPAPLLYSDLDFQVTNLLATDKAVDSIRALETRSGVRFDTIMTLAFANLFPYLLDRSAPRLIAIGADPFRAVPPPNSEVLQAIADVDLALYPKCPVTWANVRLWEIYGPPLKSHRRIELDDCFTAFVHPRLAASIK